MQFYHGNLRQELQRITEQEQEEKRRDVMGGGKTWWCSGCCAWNHINDDFCVFCGVHNPAVRQYIPKKSTEIRMIRFLKKLGLKNA